MVARLSDVATWLYNKTIANPSVSFMQNTRDFLGTYTTHPSNADLTNTSSYYYQYTRVKNWDIIMTDLWKCIPDVSDPTQRRPQVLCYDATDLMIMILNQMGVQTRSVRIISGQPAYQYLPNQTKTYSWE